MAARCEIQVQESKRYCIQYPHEQIYTLSSDKENKVSAVSVCSQTQWKVYGHLQWALSLIHLWSLCMKRIYSFLFKSREMSQWFMVSLRSKWTAL